MNKDGFIKKNDGFILSQDFLDLIVKDIATKNEKYFINIDKTNPFTKEFLSIMFSNNLLEDIHFVLSLSDNNTKERYVNFVLRSMSEQIIEYNYLIKNEHLIKEYFGEEVIIDDDLNLNIKKNQINGLKQISSKRYKNGRPKIYEMAKDVGLSETTNNTLSLYDIFGLTSEEIHNSYFTDFISIKNENGLTNTQAIYLVLIIKYFIETYDKVLK